MKAGLTFILFGVLAGSLGPSEQGDATHMAAGYFPRLLGYLLVAAGLAILARSFRTAPAEAPTPFVPRPFFVLPAVVAFALLIERAGLLLASVALLTIGALAARGLTARQFAVVAVVLIAVVLAIFVWGLGLPVKVWPG